MINKEQFYELHKLASSMKREVLCITNDTLYAADARFSSISIMNLDKNKYPYVLSVPLCYYKNAIINTNDPISTYINVVKFGCIQIEDIMFDNNIILYKNLSSALQHVYSYKYNLPIHQIPDLKIYDNFMEIHNSKAARGGNIINIDNFPIFVSPVLHPLNKSDKISLNIYNIDNRSFLTEYIIEKKNNTIYEYFRNRYI